MGHLKQFGTFQDPKAVQTYHESLIYYNYNNSETPKASQMLCHHNS